MPRKAVVPGSTLRYCAAMTSIAPSTPDSDHTKGMVIMVIAVLAVPVLDAIAKLLAETLSPMQIGFIRYAVQATLLSSIMVLTGRRLLTPQVFAVMPKLVTMGSLMALSVTALFWSLVYLPLANALAIFFVEPLILTIFGAVFLGERVGWHRRAAIAVGFIGTLVVLRPNVTAFGWAALLPLVAAAGFAGMLTILRSMRGRLDAVRTQALSGTFASLFLALGLLVGTYTGTEILAITAPTATQWGMLVLLGCLASGFQLMFTLAIRMAEASLLAPLQYLEIITATLLGYVIFNDFPDPLTWAGTAIILSAGLYVIHRERRVGMAKERAKPPIP